MQLLGRCWLPLALLLAASPTHALVTVGPASSGCSFEKIQDAINYVLAYERNGFGSGTPAFDDPFIAIAGGTYHEALTIDGTGIADPRPGQEGQGALVYLLGGYSPATCDNPRDPSFAASIDTGGSDGPSVVTVRGNSRVYLDLLTLSGAHGVNHGGGVDFQGTGLLDTTNVTISGNHSQAGGGIYAKGSGSVPGLTLSLRSGTTIGSNTAAGFGGGIAFEGSSLLELTGVTLSDNRAPDGGGIYAHGQGEGLRVSLHTTVIENNTVTGVGGGIAFVGHGLLQIDNTQIVSNQAGSGAGIMVAPDAATEAHLDGGVSLAFNTASQSGGGIFIKGPTKLYANSASQTLIGSNQATAGYGGGVFVVGPATAYLSANIFSNTASYGGGIAIFGARDVAFSDGTAVLSAPSSDTPVNVSGNLASFTGGGIYMKPVYDAGYNFATLCASDFRIDSNQAQEGTAIYADTDATLDLHIGGKVDLNAGCAPRSICSAGSGCNEINGNIAATPASAPTDGSTILMQTDGVLNAHRVALQKNQGGHVVRGLEVDSENLVVFNTFLAECLLTDNQVTGELITSDHTVSLQACTIANNAIVAQHVIRAVGEPVSLTDSIVNQNVDIFDFGGNTDATQRTFQFLLIDHVDSTLAPLNPSIQVGSPLFVNPGLGDYHLRQDSPGIDTAPAEGNSDLDGNRRSVDLVGIPNFPGGGIQDLGAYELQTYMPPSCVVSDTIFCSGLE
jgi:predicted outer membrane repeat protein